MRALRYALFGDESTLPALVGMLGEAVCMCVVASNRPRAVDALGDRAYVQPSRHDAAHAAFVAEVARAAPDLILCFSYSMLIADKVLAIPPLGAINIHGGLLPRFRGANVLNWALVADVPVTGVTAHYMTSGIDEGDIVYQLSAPISDQDTALTLKQRLDALGLELVSRTCAELAAGKALPRTPQDEALARHYRRRIPEDGCIDWKTMDDRAVFNLIRALVKPWPGAFFEMPDGRRVVLDRYHTQDEVAALRRQFVG